MNRTIVAPTNEGRSKLSKYKGLKRAFAVMLLSLLAIMPAVADKAKSLFAQGANQEANQNYDEAYNLYKQAYTLNPKNVQYRAAFERLKFRAAIEHIHRGRELRDDGKLAEALAE